MKVKISGDVKKLNEKERRFVKELGKDIELLRKELKIKGEIEVEVKFHA